MEKSIYTQIEQIINQKSTIAIHTISGENAIEDAVSILWKGLEQSHRTEGGLPGNFNIVNNPKDIMPNIYAYDSNNKIVVVVSIPEIMKDSNGDDWYMGIYPTHCQKYDERADSLPINQVIESEELVPKEFIAGLYIFNEGTTSLTNGVEYISGYVEKFVPNSRFIGVLPEEEQIAYFETIKDKLIAKGLKKVTDDVSSKFSFNKFLNINSYYEEELISYQQQIGKSK